MPRVGLPNGRQVLEEVANLTGGRERLDLLEVLADPPRSARTTPLLPWLLTVAIALLLTEIAGRRLSLWSRLVEAVEEVTPLSQGLPLPQRRVVWNWWRSLRAKTPSRSAGAASMAGEPDSETASNQPPPAPSADAIFEQAKRRARKRLQD
jgi:hypothetical protein